MFSGNGFVVIMAEKITYTEKQEQNVLLSIMKSINKSCIQS